MRLFLGIPTINRADLLKENLADLSKNFSDIDGMIIVDNGDQKISIPQNLKEKTELYRPGKNLGVAASWNYIMRQAFVEECADHVIILNDDIVMGYDRKYIEDRINEYPGYYLMRGSFFWSILIISKECYEAIGEFDEKFYPAYYEDDDYWYRIRLKFNDDIDNHYINLKSALKPSIERNSMTIKKDPNLNRQFNQNGKYFMEKWGGRPRKEKFKYPFNKKPMKDKPTIEEIKVAWSKLGTKKMPGSSIHAGKAYHEVPFPELRLPVHRSNLKVRVNMMLSEFKKHNYNLNGTYGLDLGCSVGGLTFSMCKNGAKQVLGVDYDSQSTDVAKLIEQRYNTGAKFLNIRADLDTLDEIIEKAANPKTGRINFLMWYSNFMWILKQLKIDDAAAFMQKLTSKCDVMFFESSQGDCMAGPIMKKYSLTSGKALHDFLVANTPFDKINNLGNANDGWANRDVFACFNPTTPHRFERKLHYVELIDTIKNEDLPQAKGVTSTVFVDEANNRVIKEYKPEFRELCLNNEYNTLNSLTQQPEHIARHFPKPLYRGGRLIEMEFKGKHLKKDSLPEDYEQQKEEILEGLSAIGKVHRDITPSNLVIHDGVIILIDFGWASLVEDKDNPPKEAVGLGVHFKDPSGYNDRYSFDKSLEAIKQ